MTPPELEHFGVKGMHWGVRKSANVDAATVARRKNIGKKVAIGVGATALTAGTAFVAYRLSQGGHIPVHTASQGVKDAAAVHKFVSQAGGSKEAEEFAKQFLKAAGR